MGLFTAEAANEVVLTPVASTNMVAQYTCAECGFIDLFGEIGFCPLCEEEKLEEEDEGYFGDRDASDD